jgi:protein SCO1/2
MGRTYSTCRRRLALVLLCLVLATAGAPARAQANPDLPQDLAAVGLADRLDAQVPLDLKFLDEQDRLVSLGDYFVEGKPVLLTLVYYRCPMLCTLVLDGMVDALKPLDWVPGDQFEIVTVTIDPNESSDLARNKKKSYLASYGKPAAERGWHFLSGHPDSIVALADAVGFRYQKVEETNEYAHPAALFILTPEGRLSRYLTGVQHDPQTLRLSLVEASEGKIGNPLDKFLLYCYRYDAEEGRYAPVAMRIMQAGGGLMVVILGGALLAFWLREIRIKRKRHA